MCLTHACKWLWHILDFVMGGIPVALILKVLSFMSSGLHRWSPVMAWDEFPEKLATFCESLLLNGLL